MEKLLPSFEVTSDAQNINYDGVIIFGTKSLGVPSQFTEAIRDYTEIDEANEIVKVVPCPSAPGRRIVFANIGSLTGDFDDVRNLRDAAETAVKRCRKAGSKNPLVFLPGNDTFPLASRASLLGLLHGLYTPLEIRETKPDAKSFRKLHRVGLFCKDEAEMEKLLLAVRALEAGRIAARDIGGSDPERMAAPQAADYVTELFKDSCVSVKVVSDVGVFEKEYPLLAAVNRCCRNVPRHAGRLIFLEYTGEEPVQKTLLLVGKGITYDTGGADIKAGGVMAGMHRDKCGAAAVAGFFEFLAKFQPKGIKVIGAMAMVRNSVGSECYVSDEIITSRAGVRVRIGNTDAEGRMVMADVLCYMKERALSEINPHIFTVATLTGHVIRCYGENYTSVMDNGPAWKANVSKTIAEAGDRCGEPCEVTRLRKEDFAFIAPPTEYEDVVQANSKPSTMTDRGHQYPAAFLITASGLRNHGNDSASPLRYTHMDVAGSSGPFPGIPTGAPILALAHAFVLDQ